MLQPIHIVGGGLAGSEAAWQIARAGIPVVLHEMRPHRTTEAHKTDGLAELVCSNSFRSDDAETNAVGLLHEEMRRAGSLIMSAGDAHKLPGRRRARRRPRSFLGRGDAAPRRAPPDCRRARRDRGAAASRVG